MAREESWINGGTRLHCHRARMAGGARRLHRLWPFPPLSSSSKQDCLALLAVARPTHRTKIVPLRWTTSRHRCEMIDFHRVDCQRLAAVGALAAPQVEQIGPVLLGLDRSNDASFVVALPMGAFAELARPASTGVRREIGFAPQALSRHGEYRTTSDVIGVD